MAIGSVFRGGGGGGDGEWLYRGEEGVGMKCLTGIHNLQVDPSITFE